MDERTDMVSAALRHLRDARVLLDGGPADSEPYTSPDQAWHLAGFGPECARKAVLPERGWDQLIGHDLGEASDEIVDWVEALDPRSGRFPIRRLFDDRPELALWQPQHRYQRTGTTSVEKARRLLDQAQEVSDRVLVSLWLAGFIERFGV